MSGAMMGNYGIGLLLELFAGKYTKKALSEYLFICGNSQNNLL
jgi:hypothetical protein